MIKGTSRAARSGVASKVDMKTWIRVGILVIAAASPGLAWTAQAQTPRPLQRHEERKEERREERKEENKEERRDERKEERRDEHVAVVDMREHFLKRQEHVREIRKEERKDLKAWRAKRVERAEEHRKDITATWSTVVHVPE